MSESLISVIMPVFNAEKRLEISINSILNQTYQNLELILVDDGSTDASLIICDQFAQFDSRVKVVHQKNARVSAARNRGIQLAEGQYLSFIDADDEIDLDTYEIVMKEFVDNRIDMVIFGMQFEYYKEQQVHRREIKSIEKKRCFDVKNINECFFYLSEHNYFLSSCNKVTKSSIIKENDIFFEKDMSILEDFKFVLDVLEKSQTVCALTTPFYHYYHNLQLSHLKRRPNIDYIKNFQILDRRLRDFAKKFGLDKGMVSKKIDGMILRYYIIAIEKLYSSDASFRYKYTEMKQIITLVEFESALENASVSGLRLKLVCFLLNHKCFTTLFILFSVNDFLEKVRR